MKECVLVSFRFLMSFSGEITILPCCARDEFKPKSSMNCFATTGERIYEGKMEKKSFTDFTRVKVLLEQVNMQNSF